MVRNKDRVLLLLDSDSDVFAREFRAIENVTVRRVFRQTSIYGKILRRIHAKLTSSLFSVWLEDWCSDIDSADVVIIHASKMKDKVVKYIRYHFPHKRIIFWYWNPVVKTLVPDSTIKKLCECWTFDPEDAKKYGLKLNTQFYFRSLVSVSKNENAKQLGVYFVGKDKGRYAVLRSIEKQLHRQNVSTLFTITPDSKNNSVLKFVQSNRKEYSDFISYECVLENIKRSTAILDVVSDNQSGLTLRPLEALFFGKKLITNDASIKKCDFYTKDSVFVLGQDDINNLTAFLCNNNKRSSRDKYIKKYDALSWLRRFEER